MTWLRRWFPLRTKGQAAVDHSAPTEAAEPTTPQDLPVVPPVGIGAMYPPIDGGLPLCTPAELIAAQGELMDRLRLHAALPAELFASRFMEPVQSAARYVLNLPGSPEGLFAGPGGLFRACTEMAFGCFQAADGRIFTGQLGVEGRHRLEGRWRYVCFLAGLLWPLGRTLEAVRVVSIRGDAWPSRAVALSEWCSPETSASVWCNWTDDIDRPGPAASGAALLNYIVGVANLAWLEDGSADLVSVLAALVSGAKSPANTVAFDLITAMWERLAELEQCRMPQHYGRLRFGNQAGPYVASAIEVLARGKWAALNGPLLVDSAGAYLVWPAAAVDIIAELDTRGIVGLPATPAGLAELIKGTPLLDIKDGLLVEVANLDGEVVPALVLRDPTLVVSGFPTEFREARAVRIQSIMAQQPTSRLRPPAAASTVAAEPLEESKAPTHALKEAQGKEEPQEDLPIPPPAAADPFASLDSSAAEERPPTTEGSNDGAGQTPEEKRVVEVRYADTLPARIRPKLRARDAENFGKLAATTGQRWVDGGEWVGVDLEDVGAACMDVPGLVEALAAAGFLIIDPSTPGRKVYEHRSGEVRRRVIRLSMTVAKEVGWTNGA